MAQTVNEVTDLMSDKPHRSRSSFQLPNTAKYFFMVLVMGLLLLILAMGAKALRDAPPATIVVEQNGLSTSQFETLQDTMQQQAVSSFFTTDMQALRDIAVGLAWIDQVSVTRDWQRGIVVTALPKQAVAKFGTERFIDASGKVFVPTDSKDLAQNEWATLQGEIDEAPVIMQQMQQINEWYAPLNLQVEDIILTPRMTWLIRFDNGLRVIVDNENTAQKLLSLSQLLNNQLNPRLNEMQSIDLRYRNGFTIAWNASVIEAPNDSKTEVSEDLNPIDLEALATEEAL